MSFCFAVVRTGKDRVEVLARNGRNGPVRDFSFHPDHNGILTTSEKYGIPKNGMNRRA